MNKLEFSAHAGMVRLARGTTITTVGGKQLPTPVVIDHDGVFLIQEAPEPGLINLGDVKEPVTMAVRTKDDGSVEMGLYDGDLKRIHLVH